MIKEDDIFFIRHAESIFNAATKLFKNKNNCTLEWN